ncbi:hypothetical protein [Streptomyces sp. NPDC046909]|uniref:hypothetical protein n=1 Tax=Streptomyces sp. NPDC046909 TaxID=3155617 RepID=UPI003411DB37
MVAITSVGGQFAAMHNRLTAMGQSWRAPLAAYVDEVHRQFADQVAASVRRMVAETCDARRATLPRFLPDTPPEAPFVVHITVSLG